MKKLKHHKLRNTGLLFEILSRMVMHETIDPNQKQSAIKIIKNHFKQDSNLLKELRLYQTLCQRTNLDSKELLMLTLESKQSIDNANLIREKYDLVRSIKKNYNLEVFFDTRVSNYTLNAATYKLLEYQGRENPEDYLNSKTLVLEQLSGIREESPEEEVMQTFREVEPEIRNLGFKMIIERFNDKYRTLNERQKELLVRYINYDPNQDEFKKYVLKESGFITRKLTDLTKRITDDVTRIKLNETINLIENIITTKQIKEDHLSSLLKYYELIEELEDE